MRQRLTLCGPVICYLVLGILPAIFADEISLKEEAPGILEDVNNWIKENTSDKVGFSVGGVDVYVNRHYEVRSATYDPETTRARIQGNIRYKTGRLAAIPISVSTDFDVKYTIRTGDIEGAKFELQTSLGDIAIDFTPIKKVIDGDLAAALELIPNGGLVKRETSSEYDSRKKWYEDRYGEENVYFASSDFVRWASPETAGEWILTLIASGGSSASAIGREVQSQMRKELTHIAAWLQTKLASNAQQVAENIVSGGSIVIPELKLFWQNVTYRSKATIAGVELPEIAVGHAAFVLVWTTPSSPPADFDSTPTRQREPDNKPRPKWRLGARYAIGPTGSRIVFITPNGAAEIAGLKVDDIILEADGVPAGVTDNETDVLIRQIKKSPDQTMSLKVQTESAVKTITVQLQPVF